MTHKLKTLPEFWDAVKSGEKTFEVRRNDRNFMVGDTLELIRHADSDERIITCEITYVLTGGQFGIEPGYSVLGLGSIK